MDKDIFSEIKTALENIKLPFEIHGAIVFGSVVKGEFTLHSDIDLIIVAEGINPKRHRRGEEILLIKKSLPVVPLDILLFSPKEVISNFKNHNPLFLDIAEDGIILLDRNNFLKALIEETKRYINAKAIKRLKDGWEFPTKYGAITYLSGVSNKDFSIAMFKDGKRDYLIGKKLIDEGFYDKAVYHFQQSVEKCLKSILVAFGIFRKTHFVGEVLIETLRGRDIPELWEEKLLKIAEISETLEPEVSLSRYPGIIDDSLWLPFEEYEKDDAEIAEKKAKDVLSVTNDFIEYWFSESKEIKDSKKNKD